MSHVNGGTKPETQGGHDSMRVASGWMAIGGYMHLPSSMPCLELLVALHKVSVGLCVAMARMALTSPTTSFGYCAH